MESLGSHHNEVSPFESVHGAIKPYPVTHLSSYEEYTLFDYWRVLWKRKIQIVLVTVVCIGLAYLFTNAMTIKYKAQVTLMPLTSSGSSGISNLASQVSSLPLVGSQLSGIGGLTGGKSKELVSILKSRTLTKKVVDKFNLMKVIFAKQYNPATNTYSPNWLGGIPFPEDAVNVFIKKIANIEEDKKSGLIKIDIKMKDPVLAASVANEMVFQLQHFIENNSLTLSKRNRVFIEEQLVKNGSKLLEAGKELNSFYAQNKISSVVPELDVNVGTYETIAKPFEDFQQVDEGNRQGGAQIEKMREEATVKKVPGQVYLQYLTLNRELISKSHALLTQQYELAKIEESKEDLAFQVIDKAEVKVRPSSPQLMLNLAVGVFGGFFLAVFIAFFREYVTKLKAKESPR